MCILRPFSIRLFTLLIVFPSVPEGNLDGYQKKKYLAKVVFTYILGYKVDVGHMEAVNLISSSKYSEKQIVSRHLSVCRFRPDVSTRDTSPSRY